jgi:hypothetical protein
MRSLLIVAALVLGAAVGATAVGFARAQGMDELPVVAREPVAPASTAEFAVVKAQFIELIGPGDGLSIVMDGGKETGRPQILFFRNDETKSLAMALELVNDNPRIVKYRRGAHSFAEVMANYAPRR